MKRVSLVLTMMIIGALWVPLNQVGKWFGSGWIKEARAQTANTCCVPPAQSFTKLAEGDVSPTTDSAIIPVAPYREVVIYVSNFTGNCFGGSGIIDAQFRPDASTPFGSTGQGNYAGRLRVDGPDLKLHYVCSTGSVHFVVAGVQ